MFLCDFSHFFFQIPHDGSFYSPAFLREIMAQNLEFHLAQSRYYRPTILEGGLSDFLTDDLELSAYGEAALDRPFFPGVTPFKDRQWYCFLCVASFDSPWLLTDHVIQAHPKEHAFFLDQKPEGLLKCPIDG